MRVIAKSTLCNFLQHYADAKGTLEAWHDEVLAAKWKTPRDIENRYPTVRIYANNRFVFNICDNKYRLVVEVQYGAEIIWIKFIGTRSECDLIDLKIIDNF